MKAVVTLCTPHDLRRTTATNLARVGVPTETISRILNHRTGGVTTRHYALYGYLEEKRVALEVLAKFYCDLGMVV